MKRRMKKKRNIQKVQKKKSKKSEYKKSHHKKKQNEDLVPHLSKYGEDSKRRASLFEDFGKN